jgi:hypothetical protein
VAVAKCPVRLFAFLSDARLLGYQQVSAHVERLLCLSQLLLYYVQAESELLALGQQTKKREVVMKKSYAKSLKVYDTPVELDSKKIWRKLFSS